MRWTRQPQYPARLDWSNPITRGLGFVQCGGFGNGKWVAAAISASAVLKATNKGVGYGAVTGSRVRSVNIFPTTSGVYSIFSVAVHDGGGGSGDIQTILDDDASTRNLQFRIWNSVAQVIRFNTIGTPFFADSATIAQADLLSGINVGAVCNGVDFSVHVNGVKTASTITSGVPTSGDPAGDWRVGNGKDSSSTPWKRAIPLLMVWDRALSDAEMASLNANPWQIFQPLDQRVSVSHDDGSADAAVSTSQGQTIDAAASVGITATTSTSQGQSATAAAVVSADATASTSQAQSASATATLSVDSSASTAQAQAVTATATVSTDGATATSQAQSSDAAAELGVSAAVTTSQAQSVSAAGDVLSGSVSTSQGQSASAVAEIGVVASASSSQAQSAEAQGTVGVSAAVATSQAQAATASATISLDAAASTAQAQTAAAAADIAAAATTAQGQTSAATATIGIDATAATAQAQRILAGELSSDAVASTSQGQSALALARVGNIQIKPGRSIAPTRFSGASVLTEPAYLGVLTMRKEASVFVAPRELHILTEAQ